MEKLVEDVKRKIRILGIEYIFQNNKGKTFDYIEEIEEFDNLTIVRLKGAIDSSTIPAIRAKFDSRIKKTLDKNILLDVKKVTNIDSSTLASLIQLLSDLKKRNRKLGITNTTVLLKNYLNITKLKSAVQIYKSEKAALGNLLQN